MASASNILVIPHGSSVSESRELPLKNDDFVLKSGHYFAIRGNAPIYPAPGYWIHGNMNFAASVVKPPTCDGCLPSEEETAVRNEMIDVLPELKCPGSGQGCVGTVIDRDWTSAFSVAENR